MGMDDIVVYVHGKGGSAAEAAHYVPLFPGRDVIGFDYHAQNPWQARKESESFSAAACTSPKILF